MMSRIRNLIRNINYLSKHSLWDQRECDIVYITNKILDDGIYEYNIELQNHKKLNILDTWKSIDYISKTGKSFVRFNDGEINLMKGLDQPFQKYDEALVVRLFKTLKEPNGNIAVGINKNYFVPLYDWNHNEYIRRHAYEFRRFFLEHCSQEKIYIDGSFTFWNFGEHGEESERFWHIWKEMFRDKSIAIICGEGILDSLEYDVFEYCKDRTYVYGPRKHAWLIHKELIEEIQARVDKNTILLFILGMAGKAMISEVTDLGYIAWDIGHLAKSYDAYMKNIKYTPENIKNFYAPD